MAAGKVKYPQVAVLQEKLQYSKKEEDKRLMRELDTLLERDWRLAGLEK